jgi:hypothetical protein
MTREEYTKNRVDLIEEMRVRMDSLRKEYIESRKIDEGDEEDSMNAVPARVEV